jgi:hypothetical protein
MGWTNLPPPPLLPADGRTELSYQYTVPSDGYMWSAAGYHYLPGSWYSKYTVCYTAQNSINKSYSWHVSISLSVSADAVPRPGTPLYPVKSNKDDWINARALAPGAGRGVAAGCRAGDGRREPGGARPATGGAWSRGRRRSKEGPGRRRSMLCRRLGLWETDLQLLSSGLDGHGTARDRSGTVVCSFRWAAHGEVVAQGRILELGYKKGNNLSSWATGCWFCSASGPRAASVYDYLLLPTPIVSMWSGTAQCSAAKNNSTSVVRREFIILKRQTSTNHNSRVTLKKKPWNKIGYILSTW